MGRDQDIANRVRQEAAVTGRYVPSEWFRATISYALNEQQTYFLGKIRSGVDTVTEMIGDLLDAIGISHGQLEDFCDGAVTFLISPVEEIIGALDDGEVKAEMLTRLSEMLVQRGTLPGARQALAISPGGPIGQLVAATLDTPPEQQIRLQLQTRNCGVTRFVYSAGGAFYFHGFNETPHITAANEKELLTYS